MGFEQLIKEPTCQTGGLIDHLYVNNAMKTKTALEHFVMDGNRNPYFRTGHRFFSRPITLKVRFLYDFLRLKNWGKDIKLSQ